MDETEFDILEALLDAQLATAPADEARRDKLHKLRERLYAARLVAQMPKPKPAWWFDKNLLQLVLAIIAIIASVLGFKIPLDKLFP